MKSRSTQPCRNATAVVELAICLPILMVLAFGSIEASNAIYLKQSITTAAYEGARTASSTGGSQQAALLRIKEVLATHQLTNANIAIVPPIDASLSRGTSVSVTVSIPLAESPIGVTGLFSSGDVTATISMIRQ